MRYLLLIVLLLIPSFLRAADPPAKKEPAELAQAKAALERDLAKAKAAYDLEAATAVKQFAARLEKLQKELTMKGDLEGALAVKGAKESAGPGAAATPAAAGWSPAGQVWSWPGNTIQFRRDGLVATANKVWETGGMTVSWRMAGPRVVLLRVEKGRDKDRDAVLLFNDGPNAFSGWDFDGTKVTGTLSK